MYCQFQIPLSQDFGLTLCLYNNGKYMIVFYEMDWGTDGYSLSLDNRVQNTDER